MRWVLILACLATPVRAEEKLDGAAITAALSGQALHFDDGAAQSFKADGETVYTMGKESIGHWQVQGDRYCSVWPPSDHWACYAVSREGDSIRFTAEDGSASVGHLAPPP